MARPRIFISSTFYDLQYIREDLERFIRTMGYEAVRHEKGGVPYAKEAPLEESAYSEVGLSDIVVCVIGGRYGTESGAHSGSITQNELSTALEKGIQVYIFIEQNVHTEFFTYKENKSITSVKYRFVDDVKVYEFVEKIFDLPQNNPITPFSRSEDISSFLQAQWAGLFQRSLQEQRRASEVRIVQEMKTVAGTLQQLVEFLTKERADKDEAIKSILFTNHPVYSCLRKLLNPGYRIFFSSQDELNDWLKIRRYNPVKKTNYDQDSVLEWVHGEEKKYLKLTNQIFDDAGKLKVFSKEEWRDNWFQLQGTPETTPQ